MASEPTAQGADAPGLSRLEIAIVATILVGGILLRVAFPDRMAVEHFDEGVYASNLWFDAGSGGQYPARQLYAPPFVPALIESSLLAEQVFAGSAIRPSGLAAMFPNLLAGCLTLWIVWWVMRAWFGPAAAIGATTLASGSEFHALYSRTALTDVLLLPWMLLGVFLFERAVATRQLRLLLLAGLACGLAWWTKYNGWLPLLIGLGGIMLRLAFVKAARQSVGPDLAYWTGFAAIAVAVWSPFLWSLQASGGYAQVMANHRGYAVGLSGWPASLTNQLANLTHFDGWISCLAPATALLLVWLYRRRSQSLEADSDKHLTSALMAVAVTVVAAWDGLVVAVSFLSVAGLLGVGLRPQKYVNHEPVADSLAIWLVAAWFAGLFVLTPLYSPYPRLTLTWLCASWLAGGLGIAVISGSGVRRADVGRVNWYVPSRYGRLALVVLLIVLPVQVYFSPARRGTVRGFRAWQDRSGLNTAANSIVEQIDVENSIVFVQGEPGLFYHLRAAGVAAEPGFHFKLSPASLPDGVVAYLATGLHAQRSEEFQRQLAAGKSRLEEVAAIPYQPSDLVLLNNYRPHQLAAQQRAAWCVRLYRLK